jgi:tetratricopeptide (TPR) repeat protein
MTRRDSGTPVSCRDLAEFEMARSYAGGSGLFQPSKVEEFIRTHPNSPFLSDARALANQYSGLSTTSERRQFAAAFDGAPLDPRYLAILERDLSRFSDPGETNPIAEAGLSYARRFADWMQSTPPESLAALQAGFLSLKGDFAGAEAAYGPNYLDDRVHAWALFLLDYAEFWRRHAKNEEGAMSAVRLALSMNPDDASVRQTAARVCLISPPQADEAEAIFGPAWLKASDRSPEELYAYANFWLGLEANRDSALAALDMLLAKAPGDFFYIRTAVALLWQAGETAKVEAVFGPAFAAAHADRLGWLYEYGSFWLTRGLHVEEAVSALVKSASDPVQSWRTKWSAAELLQRSGRQTEAEKVFGADTIPALAGDRMGLSVFISFWAQPKSAPAWLPAALEAFEKVPNLSWTDRWQVASAYLKLGRKDQAERIYGSAYLAGLKDVPEEMAQYAQFWTYRKQNLLSAMEAIRAAISLDPARASAWAVHAQLLQIDGRLDEALKAIEKAIALTESADDKTGYEQRRGEIVAALKR